MACELPSWGVDGIPNLLDCVADLPDPLEFAVSAPAPAAAAPLEAVHEFCPGCADPLRDHIGMPMLDDRDLVKAHAVELLRNTSEFTVASMDVALGGGIPVRAWRIVSPDQRERFERASRDDAEPTMRLLHGTRLATDASLRALAVEGLDPRLSRSIGTGAPGGYLGCAAYLTPTFTKANHYTVPYDATKAMALDADRNGIRRMAVCDVAVGRIHTVAPGCHAAHLVREPPGFDSVVGTPRGDVEHAIYNRDRIRVLYVIDYYYTPPTLLPFATSAAPAATATPATPATAGTRGKKKATKSSSRARKSATK